MTRLQITTLQRAGLPMPSDGATVTRHLPALPHIVRALASGEWSSKEHRLSPRCAGQPPRSYAQVDVVYYVLEGQPTFRLGDQTIHANAGHWIVASRGTVHTVFNASDEPARILSFCIGGAFVEALCETDSALRLSPC